MPSRSDVLVAEHFNEYVQKASDENVVKAIEKSGRNLLKLLKNLSRKKIDYAYGEGKWTIREVLQHIIDAERVFAYRAVAIARKDATPLPSFDENLWGAHSQASSRKWKSMLREFSSMHEANIIMFETFSDDQLRSIGVASNKEINVLGLGYIMSGHIEHHLQIIRDRYLGKKA